MTKRNEDKEFHNFVTQVCNKVVGKMGPELLNTTILSSKRYDPKQSFAEFFLRTYIKNKEI